jgi:hypothetical protein
MGEDLSDHYCQLMLNNTSTLVIIFRHLDRLMREVVQIAVSQHYKPGEWILPKQTVKASEPFPQVQKVVGNFQG